jgi:hypothetical protein
VKRELSNSKAEFTISTAMGVRCLDRGMNSVSMKAFSIVIVLR